MYAASALDKKFRTLNVHGSRDSFDHDECIAKGAIRVNGSLNVRKLPVAELRTTHWVSQGINQRGRIQEHGIGIFVTGGPLGREHRKRLSRTINLGDFTDEVDRLGIDRHRSTNVVDVDAVECHGAPRRKIDREERANFIRPPRENYRDMTIEAALHQKCPRGISLGPYAAMLDPHRETLHRALGIRRGLYRCDSSLHACRDAGAARAAVDGTTRTDEDQTNDRKLADPPGGAHLFPFFVVDLEVDESRGLSGRRTLYGLSRK